MLQCTGVDLAPLPPSVQQTAKAAGGDSAHTPNDEQQRPDHPPRTTVERRDNLADALSALLSFVPDAADGDRRAGFRGGQVLSSCAPAAGTPENTSSDEEEEGGSSCNQEDRGTGVRGGDGRIVAQLNGDGTTQGESGVAERGISDAVREEGLRYLEQLPNGAELAATLARRLKGVPPVLSTVADPQTQTFHVAPTVADDDARTARLVALIKYKRKREQQKLHPQVRYKSRKMIADNRVSHHAFSPPSPRLFMPGRSG
jgi:hypothetical protein